jgi:hypothetical protein
VIEGFEIMPSQTHLATYRNERNITNPTSSLEFNGIWQIKIDEPFYNWRHRITGQGYLLEPITTVHDYVANSSSTRATMHRIETVDSAEYTVPTRVPTIGPELH